MAAKPLVSVPKNPGVECPRERLLRCGARSLSDQGLLEVILGGRGRGKVASNLLEQHGLRGIAHLSANLLSDRRGIGVVRATILVAAVELGRRIRETQLQHGQRFDSSAMVAAAFQPRLSALKQEHFYAIAVNSKNRVLAERLVSAGGLASCGVSPSDVYRLLLLEGASGVVFVHNHPSGDVQPSEDDTRLTERLILSGNLLGIRVLDHVIVGHDGYFSFLDAGLLQQIQASSSSR